MRNLTHTNVYGLGYYGRGGLALALEGEGGLGCGRGWGVVVFVEGVGREVSFNCFQEFQVVEKKVVVVGVGPVA